MRVVFDGRLRERVREGGIGVRREYNKGTWCN